METRRKQSVAILAYWLIPAEPAYQYFRALISELAVRFDAPVFGPHVTLYGTKAAGEDPAGVLQSAVTNVKPLRLSVAGLDCSDEFTKTLYVQFHSDAALRRLSEGLQAASVSQRGYKLNPHLSLIYKTMAPEAKRQIMNSLALAFAEVDFDSVQAIITPPKVESREDVEAWRTVATRPLIK
jgi:predicted component of type VI protein secretion system